MEKLKRYALELGLDPQQVLKEAFQNDAALA